MKTHNRIRHAVIFFTICFFATSASAQGRPTSLNELIDGISSIPYDSQLPFVVGDTLHVNDLSAPRARCIDYKPEDIKTDSNGSISGTMRLRLVQDFGDLERDFKFSFSAHAAAKASVLDIASGSSSLTGFGKFDRFMKSQHNSMMLVLDIEADYGRKLIENYSFETAAQEMLDAGDIKGFVDRCGTHFVRGYRQEAGVKVIFFLEGLNSQAKSLVQTKFDTMSKASGGFEGISAEVESKMSTDISYLTNLVSKFGSVSGEVSVVGGSGVETLTQLVGGMTYTPQDFTNLLAAIKEAGKDFTPAPTALIIIPFPGVPAVAENQFDPERYAKMGEIYKALLRVDNELSIHEGYKTQNYALWNRYFRVRHEELDALRLDLATAYTACKKEGLCKYDTPTSIQGIYLGDLVEKVRLVGECAYGLAGDENINDISTINSNVLSSVTVRLAGIMNFAGDVDPNGIQISRITPDLNVEQLPFRVQQQYRSQEISNVQDRIYISIYRKYAEPKKAIADGSIDWAYLQDVRRDAARSVYLMKIPLSSGMEIEEVIGYPNMQGCLLQASY